MCQRLALCDGQYPARDPGDFSRYYMSLEILRNPERYVAHCHGCELLICLGNTRQEQHLLGAYAFATGCSAIDLRLRGISQSGIWNYLREEITISLECRRAVRIPDGLTFVLGQELPVDMWTNSITYILARVVNFCFEDRWEKEGFIEIETEWKLLALETNDWRTNLPITFEPFSTAPKARNIFPSLWMLRPWHGKSPSLASKTSI